jgi:hypothetical protein
MRTATASSSRLSALPTLQLNSFTEITAVVSVRTGAPAASVTRHASAIARPAFAVFNVPSFFTGSAKPVWRSVSSWRSHSGEAWSGF